VFSSPLFGVCRLIISCIDFRLRRSMSNADPSLYSPSLDALSTLIKPLAPLSLKDERTEVLDALLQFLLSVISESSHISVEYREIVCHPSSVFFFSFFPFQMSNNAFKQRQVLSLLVRLATVTGKWSFWLALLSTNTLEKNRTILSHSLLSTVVSSLESTFPFPTATVTIIQA